MKPEIRDQSSDQSFDIHWSDDSEENTGFNGAELSESVLGRDWSSRQEDAAWSNL